MSRFKKLFFSFVYIGVTFLTACEDSSKLTSNASTEKKSESVDAEASREKVIPEIDSQSGDTQTLLSDILASQSDEIKARYQARHPEETLTFFGIKPGMTVVEALPGSGWYTKVLLAFLGPQGAVVGADYAADLYPKFNFLSEEALEAKKTWISTWTNEAEKWRNGQSAAVTAFQLGSMSDEIKQSADAVLFVRALHNLARFENDGGYLTSSLRDAFDVLKPGGIVGIVQHEAPEGSSDKWSDGSNGYLKKAKVMSIMDAAGFEFVASSDINRNPNDQPTESDIVWRLPPSLYTSGDDAELKKKYLAIGESNRMTLLFKKPL